MISLISVEEIRGRDRSDLLSSILILREAALSRTCASVLAFGIAITFRLAQHPGERNLGRSRAMGLRDFL